MYKIALVRDRFEHKSDSKPDDLSVGLVALWYRKLAD